MKVIVMNQKTQDKMFRALTNLEGAVSKAAGLVELLKLGAITDRTADGGASRIAACGIDLLSQDITQELHDAYTSVFEANKAGIYSTPAPVSPAAPGSHSSVG